MSFLHRVQRLPSLGLGPSTEYGAGGVAGALDVERLRRRHPSWAGFLEIGVEVAKGLDADATRWVAAKRPCTYHFLDVNLDEPEDLDPAWLDALRALIGQLRPAWLCGDAGLWHFGRRDRGQMLLLPPILCDEAADRLAAGIVALREATGLEVLPENPPGSVFLGDLHLLDFFARVAHQADTGLLLDCAHLAIYQRLRGCSPLTGMDGFPLDRVVEMHVAGGKLKQNQGFSYVDDDHGPEVLPDTWAIAEYVARRAPNLRAIVVEAERNPLDRVRPIFARAEGLLKLRPPTSPSGLFAGSSAAG